jgi:hypothetical protein
MPRDWNRSSTDWAAHAAANERTVMPVAPTINLNGTGADDLIQQLREAIDAVDSAQEALHKATPHGRDYQVGPARYEVARAEHVLRLTKLEEVSTELRVIFANVYQQQSEREARRR